MKAKLSVVVLPLLLLLSACASDSSRPDAAQSGSAGGAGQAPHAAATAGATSGGASVADHVATRVVYFDFDSDDLRADALRIVDGWAAYLVANPNARVRLAGHADERGTREYNVGLGERRGNAVERALTARGASSRQIDVISFGEERPVALGHNEQAWSQNRRVELTD
jgi:peptidoglycan-associated lipoprotein